MPTILYILLPFQVIGKEMGDFLLSNIGASLLIILGMVAGFSFVRYMIVVKPDSISYETGALFISLASSWQVAIFVLLAAAGIVILVFTFLPIFIAVTIVLAIATWYLRRQQKKGIKSTKSS